MASQTKPTGDPLTSTSAAEGTGHNRLAGALALPRVSPQSPSRPGPQGAVASKPGGWGGGQGLQVGMASGQMWTQGFAAKGRRGAQEGCRLERGASGERACVPHLVGLNSCWKEAPEFGEWLLGPPFQQQGHLGMGQGLEPLL